MNNTLMQESRYVLYANGVHESFSQKQGDGETDFFPIEFPSVYNRTIQGRNSDFPRGNVVLGGVPFNIPLNGNNEWGSGNGIGGQSGNNGQFTATINIDTFGVIEVFTLINTDWGTPQSGRMKVQFLGSDGAFFEKDLIGDDDIRDWNVSPTFTDEINGVTTVEVWNIPDGKFNSPDVMDMQIFEMPEDFADETLVSMRVIDNRQTSFHSGLLSGVTVLADIQPPQSVQYDFNNNNFNDILFTGPFGNLQSWNVFWDTRTRTFDVFPQNLNTPALKASGIGDVDGNGNPDIVYQAEDGIIFVRFDANQGSNAYWGVLPDTANPNAILKTPGLEVRAIFDRNGDGRDEILFYQSTEGGPFAKGTNFIYDSGLTSGVPKFDLLTGLNGNPIVTPDLQPVAAGLLTGDSIPDIIYHNPNSGEVKILNLASDIMEAFNPNDPDQTIPGFEVRGTLNLNAAKQDVMLLQAQAGSTGPLLPWAVTTFDRMTGTFGQVIAVTPDLTALA